VGSLRNHWNCRIMRLMARPHSLEFNRLDLSVAVIWLRVVVQFSAIFWIWSRPATVAFDASRRLPPMPTPLSLPRLHKAARIHKHPLDLLISRVEQLQAARRSSAGAGR
jgi:hypothetical protein